MAARISWIMQPFLLNNKSLADIQLGNGHAVGSPGRKTSSIAAKWKNFDWWLGTYKMFEYLRTKRQILTGGDQIT